MLERILAMLLALLSPFLPGGAEPTDAALAAFDYSQSASYFEGNYSYGARSDGEGLMAEYYLYCGNLEYSIPMTEADAAELRAIIDRNDIWKWHGFDESSRLLLDGDGFSLYAGFEDGTEISAHGYGLFPDGFGAASSQIDALFMEILERNGIDPEKDYYGE